MNKFLIALLVVVGSLVAYHGEETQADVVVLKFTAPWCAPCKQMEPDVRKLEATGVEVIRIDVNQRPDMAAGYKVDSVPVLIVVDRDERTNRTRTILGRLEGLATLTDMQQLLRKGTRAIPKAGLPSSVREAMVHVNGSSGMILVGTTEASLVGTAYHVVDGERQIKVRRDGERQSVSGRLLRYDSGNDIALLSAPIQFADPFCCVASQPIQTGDELYLHGYRGDTGDYQQKRGEVTSVRTTKKSWTRPGAPNNTLREITVARLQGITAVGGQSGGPAINTEGKVVGFISNGSEGCSPECENRGVGVTELEPLLQLCQVTDFPFPDEPILPWRKKTEDAIEEVRDIATEVPLPAPPFTSVAVETTSPNAGTGEATEHLEKALTELQGLDKRITVLEAIVEQERENYKEIKAMAQAAKEAAQLATTEGGQLFATRLAEYAKERKAETEAARESLLASVTEASKVATTAKTLAETAQETAAEGLREAKEERSLLRRGLDLVTGAPKRVWDWVTYSGPIGTGLGVLALTLAFVAWRKAIKPDISAYLREGDDLMIAPFVRRLVQLIPGQIDDNLVAAIDGKLRGRWAATPPDPSSM